MQPAGLKVRVPPPAQRPQHVAVIMDGNGRWAQDQGLPRLEGHRRGATVVRQITTFARRLGIRYLTLYSFSRQNWQRSPAEVAGLMVLLEDYCRRERQTLMEHGIRLTTIGEAQRLPASTAKALRELAADTAGNDQMTLCLAVDYGGREEMVQAVRRLAEAVRDERLQPQQVTEALLAGHLQTGDMPDPDLLIRTSGEQRISNFLLWQLAYAELYFTPTRWPAFGPSDFAAALRAFAARNRRFGATELADSLPQRLPAAGGEGAPAAELSVAGRSTVGDGGHPQPAEDAFEQTYEVSVAIEPPQALDHLQPTSFGGDDVDAGSLGRAEPARA